MESKLNLNRNLVDKARESARRIAEDTQNFIDLHTTVTVERAVCRLLGIDGVNALEVPLPNVVVDHLFDKGLLPGGAAYYIGNAMAETGMNPQQIAESIDRGELDLSAVAPHSIEEIRAAVMPVAEATAERIRTNVAKRNDYLNSFGDKTDPYLYVIVATGNIYEDIVQAKAAANRVRTSSPLSAPPGRACSTMFPTAQPPRASAEPTQLRKTSALCALRLTKSANRNIATSVCATTAPVSVCPKSPPWARWNALT